MDMEEVYLRQITEHLKRQTELQEANNEFRPGICIPTIFDNIETSYIKLIYKDLERRGKRALAYSIWPPY